MSTKSQLRALTRYANELRREVESLKDQTSPDCHCKHGRSSHGATMLLVMSDDMGLNQPHPLGHCWAEGCRCRSYSPPTSATCPEVKP